MELRGGPHQAKRARAGFSSECPESPDAETRRERPRGGGAENRPGGRRRRVEGEAGGRAVCSLGGNGGGQVSVNRRGLAPRLGDWAHGAVTHFILISSFLKRESRWEGEA